MDLFGKNLEREVVVVAEIGVNHEGDVKAASRLVHAAAQAGADAVKLQSYTAERFVAATDAGRLARARRFALDEAAHKSLAKEAAALGIGLFSTPVSEDWVPFLDSICPVIKIASGDLTFEPVIRAASATGKPVILSTGDGTMDEIERAVGWVRDEVGEAALPERLILMHCVSAYPTPIGEANVRSVPYLRERFCLPVGYSNHVLGGEAVLAAVALGAQVIEVHFTDRKEGREFRDHAMSFEPAELAGLVASVFRVRASLGEYDKRPMPCEAPVIDAIRKGVVAARDLDAGTVLGADDLAYARPATEFPAHELPALVGRRLSRAVAGGTPIPRNAIAES